ncbi:hypothetical protein ACEPAF_4738 [Sanghuangporus sanghuang]
MPRRSPVTLLVFAATVGAGAPFRLNPVSHFSPPPLPLRRSTADTTTLPSGVDALSPASSLCRSDVISPTIRRNCTGANLRRRHTQSAAATPSPVQSDSATPIQLSRPGSPQQVIRRAPGERGKKVSFQPISGPSKGTRYSLRLQRRAENSQTASATTAGQPYHYSTLFTRGQTEEPRPTAPRSPSAPNRQCASIAADDPPTRRPRRASITPFTRNPPPGESASTAAARPISPIIPPRFIHVSKDLRESEIRPSTHVRVPGSIEDLSISLQEPPATGPIETDLFPNIDNTPDIHRRTSLQLYSAAEEQEDDDLYVPDSLVHGHAITPDSPLSPVEEERSARLFPPTPLTLPTPAQRPRLSPIDNAQPPTPSTPPKTASIPTMTSTQTGIPAAPPAASGSTPPPPQQPSPAAPAPPPMGAFPPLPDLSDPDTHPLSGPNPPVPGATMPYPGDCCTLKFNASGDPMEIPIFFNRVRLFGRSAGLTDAQMIAWARCYADAKDDQLWCKRPETRGNDFMAFKDAILKYYPNATTQYTLGDLHNLINISRNQIMLNTAALGKYHRNFITVSSYLIDTGMLSEFEQKRMFREGLHPTLNRELDLNLRFVKHDHPTGMPWDIDTVVRELECILTGGRLTTADQPLMYAATAAMPTYTQVTTYTPLPQPGAPAYGVINQPQIKQEEPWVSLLIQEMRALHEATEKSNCRAPPPTAGAPLQPRQARFNGKCAGEPGMSVLDRINKLFIENPNYAPVGVQLPIQPVSDTPPRITPPRQDPTYQGQPPTQQSMYQSHPPSQESMYQGLNRGPPPLAYNTNPLNGLPPRIQESNYFEAITPEDPPDDDACDGVALLFEQEESTKQPQNAFTAAGRRPGPREVFDGIEIPTRKPPQDPNPKWGDNSKKGKPPGQRPAPLPTPSAPHRDDAADPKPQYRTTVLAYDDAAVSNVFDKILDSEVTLLIRSLLTASPEIRKKCKEFVTRRQELIRENPDHEMAMYASIPRPTSPVNFGDEDPSVAPPNIPLREIEVWLDDKFEVKALLDLGSTFIAVPKEVWKDLGSPTIMSQAITVETADRQTSRSAGLIPRVRLTIGAFSIVVQVQVVEKAPFQLLLGRPFFVHTRAQVIDEADGEQTLYLTHPDTNKTMSIPTIQRGARTEKQRPPRQ